MRIPVWSFARNITPAPVIWAASACSVLSGAAIAPALPEIERALLPVGAGIGVWGRLALVLPALVIMLIGPWIGHWCAKVHPGRGFVLSLVALAVSGVAGAFSSGMAGLLISRALLGVATAAVLCFATAAIAGLYAGPERARIIAGQSAINTFGGVVFALLGGVLAIWGWEMPFLLYLLAVPIAYFAAYQNWGEAPGVAKVARDRPAVIWPPLLALAGLMMGFYLIPTQVPFVPLLAAAPAQTGLVIAIGTLCSGVASLLLARRPMARHPVLINLAAGAMVLGLFGLALAHGLTLLLCGAALVGAGFGVLLPLSVRQIMEAAAQGSAHVLSGRIASALYAGQVGASALAVSAGPLHPSAPFWIMGLALGGVYVFWHGREGTWRRTPHPDSPSYQGTAMSELDR
ncbi:MFS transporter [Aliiroseovarius crassostreae]|uniref:MFS transporter n=1 Tax=Aliiroseovarius crassostreae TaxID=154981 RepID=UPI0021AEECD0|nr:MFS transporter [Aliiroseovarius crassostreae]UWQ00391.1 MFS transporter [Aliiroseovarius crassostreae]